MKFASTICMLALATNTYAAVKDCTVTSTSISPVVYKRTVEHRANGVELAKEIKPRDTDGTRCSEGRDCRIIFLQAGTEPNFGVGEYEALVGSGKVKSPVEFVRVFSTSAGIKEWGEYGNDIWTKVMSKFVKSRSNLQVQAAHFILATLGPEQSDVYDIKAVVDNLRARFPNLAVLYLSDINYTGYSTHPTRTLWTSVVNDGRQMANFAANPWDLHPGNMWVDYFPLAADGVKPNIRTASASFPNGVNYPCSSVSDNGLRVTAEYGKVIGINIAERLLRDPVTRGWLRD